MVMQDNATQWAGYRNAEGHFKKCREELPRTREELQTLLQVEGDRRVTQALKTASEKWQRKLLEKVEAEKCEAERLAGLAVEQLEREALGRYARELERKERDLKEKNLELKIIYLLAQNGLPLELKDFISEQEEGAALQKLETLVRIWRGKTNSFIFGGEHDHT